MAATCDMNHGHPTMSCRLRAFFHDLGEKAGKYRVYLTTIHELEELSDQDLADRGIARPMIRSIAHREAYGA